MTAPDPSPDPEKESEMPGRIAMIWVAVIWAIIIFVIGRVVIPGLINSQNDGALLAAPLLALVVGTAAYVTFVKVFTKEKK